MSVVREHGHSLDAALARLAAGFQPGLFAFVMATGIVSIAAALSGIGWIAGPLFALNLIAFPVLSLLLGLRLWYRPAAFLVDLSDRGRGATLLTIVAGTCVLANQIALLAGYPRVVAGLWVAAVVLWAALVYSFFALMTIMPSKPAFDNAFDGSWLLVVVATEALAILTLRIGGVMMPPQTAVFGSMCLFLLGAAGYALLLVLIMHRWLFLPMRPDQLTPPYWINMGAAAIATVAGARLLAVTVGAPGLLAMRGVVLAVTVLFWSLATWWIPLLVVLTVWRHWRGVRLGYRVDNWAIVFPLGMYATASWRFSHELGLTFLYIVPQLFLWVALGAWCATFLGMVRSALPRGG